MIVPSQGHINEFENLISYEKCPALFESDVKNRGFHFKKWSWPSNDLKNLSEGQGHGHRQMTPTVLKKFGPIQFFANGVF